MFPGSSIAQHYRQDRGRVKYVIEFGIFPYISEFVEANLKNQPFAYHFDKTTSNQDKKTIR